MKLTKKEQNIVRTTIKLWLINDKECYVPDYHLPALRKLFGLPVEKIRHIRDLVQSRGG